MLDKQLKRILRDYHQFLKQCELAADGESPTIALGAIKNANELDDGIIKAIKKSFADEGYYNVPDHFISMGYMKGEQWYERFLKEAKAQYQEHPIPAVDMELGVLLDKVSDQYLIAAKRAAGLEEK